MKDRLKQAEKEMQKAMNELNVKCLFYQKIGDQELYESFRNVYRKFTNIKKLID